MSGFGQPQFKSTRGRLTPEQQQVIDARRQRIHELRRSGTSLADAFDQTRLEFYGVGRELHDFLKGQHGYPQRPPQSGFPPSPYGNDGGYDPFGGGGRDLFEGGGGDPFGGSGGGPPDGGSGRPPFGGGGRPPFGGSGGDPFGGY
jgi:hypothetical protein